MPYSHAKIGTELKTESEKANCKLAAATFALFLTKSIWQFAISLFRSEYTASESINMLLHFISNVARHLKPISCSTDKLCPASLPLR